MRLCAAKKEMWYGRPPLTTHALYPSLSLSHCLSCPLDSHQFGGTHAEELACSYCSQRKRSRHSRCAGKPCTTSSQLLAITATLCFFPFFFYKHCNDSNCDCCCYLNNGYVFLFRLLGSFYRHASIRVDVTCQVPNPSNNTSCFLSVAIFFSP